MVGAGTSVARRAGDTSLLPWQLVQCLSLAIYQASATGEKRDSRELILADGVTRNRMAGQNFVKKGGRS